MNLQMNSDKQNTSLWIGIGFTFLLIQKYFGNFNEHKVPGCLYAGSSLMGSTALPLLWSGRSALSRRTKGDSLAWSMCSAIPNGLPVTSSTGQDSPWSWVLWSTAWVTLVNKNPTNQSGIILPLLWPELKFVIVDSPCRKYLLTWGT